MCTIANSYKKRDSSGLNYVTIREVSSMQTQARLSVMLHVKFLSFLTGHRNPVEQALFHTRSNDDDDTCNGAVDGGGGNELRLIN
jgi:hypothetical protein